MIHDSEGTMAKRSTKLYTIGKWHMKDTLEWFAEPDIYVSNMLMKNPADLPGVNVSLSNAYVWEMIVPDDPSTWKMVYRWDNEDNMWKSLHPLSSPVTKPLDHPQIGAQTIIKKAMGSAVPTRNEIIRDAYALCCKFIKKVESRRARSVETLSACRTLKEKIDRLYSVTGKFV